MKRGTRHYFLKKTIHIGDMRGSNVMIYESTNKKIQLTTERWMGCFG